MNDSFPSPPATRKVPATVITGFLGAGKTTLIRHLLGTAGGLRLALVINEFGDVDVDGEVLRSSGHDACAEGEIIELPNGCICCTVADAFLPTIQALLDRSPPPDHIVIETSGLALPKPLVRAFNWPEIRTRVTVDGVVTVVDCDAVAQGRFASDPDRVQAAREADDDLDHDSPIEELFRDQLNCADLVLLNKADLLDGNAFARVAAEVERELRTAVKAVRTRYAAIDAPILLGLDAAAEDDLRSRPSHHDDGEDHDHDAFEVLCVDFGAVAGPEAVVRALAPLVAEHDILRIKGFVAVAGKDMRLLVQGVGDHLHHYYDRDWRPDEERLSQLLFIGLQGLDGARISNAVKAIPCIS